MSGSEAEKGPEFWHRLWETDDIRFHEDKVHPALLAHFPSLFPDPHHVFVPLCGKSLDLAWLRDQGHWVIGSELSEIACRAFFEEQRISHESREQNGFLVFRAERLEIWCGDFFALPPEATRGVDAIYDRAALVALPRDVRKQYAEKLRALRAGILLVSIERLESPEKGPPYSVEETEVRELFPNAQLLLRKKHEWVPANEVVYRVLGAR